MISLGLVNIFVEVQLICHCVAYLNKNKLWMIMKLLLKRKKISLALIAY